jgi:hypothetical protein
MPTKEQAHNSDPSLSRHRTSRPEAQSAEIQDQLMVSANAAQKASVAPQLLTSRNILQLQRTLGNRAVGRLLAGTRDSQETVNEGLQAKPVVQLPGVLNNSLGVMAQPKRQELANNSPQGVVQRTREAANEYGPKPEDSMSNFFCLHHTPHGKEFNHATAISNHDSRASTQPNTTTNMNMYDTQSEVVLYLDKLTEEQSQDLETQAEIFFTTRKEYSYIKTEWNNGNPQVTEEGRARLEIGATWIEKDGGYYSVHHFGPP